MFSKFAKQSWGQSRPCTQTWNQEAEHHVSTIILSNEKKDQFFQIILNLKTLAHYVFSLRRSSQGWRLQKNEVT
jgi:hypothetical protein